MNSLRQKLALSYGLLIIIIFAVSAWSIYHLVTLGRAIDVILVNNYKSIVAAENMKEALERQDSAAMFFIASHADKARQQFEANSQKFSQEFEIAANNITEKGEPEIINDINAKYQAYRSELESFLNPAATLTAAKQSNIYFERLEPQFIAIKDKLDDLLRLNQQAMVAANDRAISVSQRAEISTAVTAALALALALIFAWQFTRYVVTPISTLSQKARLIGEGDLDQRISVSSKDEIGVLAAEFNRMLLRLREARKFDYGRLLIEQKKSDAVIDSLYEPVIVTDARGHVIKINRAASQLFSNGNKGDLDFSLSQFTGGERILRVVRDVVAMQRPVAAEGEAALVPIEVGGAERSFRLRATPMRDSDGRLLGAVTVLEDVTAITEVDRLKTEFISVASGKLREPLHSLQLALHAVIGGYAGELNDQQADMLVTAQENAEKLEEMMNDLLQLAEIESGARRLSIQRLRPVDLARACVERFRPLAESKQIKLENNVWPDLPWVVGDREAVARVFDNLLSNAIRHTGRGGRVTIEARERAGRVFFSVRDTGEGIPEEHLPVLFSRFARVGNKAGSTGLGLALVKRLVEAQGGQVSVESRVGEGSTFTFTMLEGGPASVRSTDQTRGRGDAETRR
ncbi:MAG TPA: ATP-binding protein [Blastocatellia bacterium]|nr:ATP-binding protein [Blastocatellia bacterium]